MNLFESRVNQLLGGTVRGYQDTIRLTGGVIPRLIDGAEVELPNGRGLEYGEIT